MNKRPITMEDEENLTYNEKGDLIRMNPATARYFDYKMKELFKVTSSPVGSFRDKIFLDSEHT
jgi:hypothetical protein